MYVDGEQEVKDGFLEAFSRFDHTHCTVCFISLYQCQIK